MTERVSSYQRLHIRNLSVLAYAQGFTYWHARIEMEDRVLAWAPGFFDDVADSLAPGDLVAMSFIDGLNAEGALAVVSRVYDDEVDIKPLAESKP